MAYHSPIDPRALRTSEAPEDVTQGMYHLSRAIYFSSVVSPRQTQARAGKRPRVTAKTISGIYGACVCLRVRVMTQCA